MAPVAEYQRVREGLFFWQGYDSAVKTDLSCCAVCAESGLVFVDPIPLAPNALEELIEESAPSAIVLTNGNHWRAASAYRARFGVPVIAHRTAAAALDEGAVIDRFVHEGEAIAGDLMAHEIEGAGPGEIALYSTRRSWLIGDALINVEPYGFSLLPDKYCTNPDVMRNSLRKLLQKEFDLLTFAHGWPLVSDARSRLAALLP